MAELTRQAGLPTPEISDAGGGVTVRFLPTRHVPPRRVARDVTERQQRILKVLAESRRGLALREITALGDMIEGKRAIREDLAVLKSLGLVQNQGQGMGAVWTLKYVEPANSGQSTLGESESLEFKLTSGSVARRRRPCRSRWCKRI